MGSPIITFFPIRFTLSLFAVGSAGLGFMIGGLIATSTGSPPWWSICLVSLSMAIALFSLILLVFLIVLGKSEAIQYRGLISSVERTATGAAFQLDQTGYEVYWNAEDFLAEGVEVSLMLYRVRHTNIGFHNDSIIVWK